MHILLTGGCGYVGSRLTERLLSEGHEVDSVDTEWFGNFLKPHERLRIFKDDIRNIDALSFDGVEVVIHLACISNDPCVDLDPLLSWEVNVLATMRLAERALRSGVKQFIYASSGSVYGYSDVEKVTEDVDLRPISVYNKTKMIAERVLLSYRDQTVMQIVRPGTICGLSPRMRLDLMVNGLTMQALTKRKITLLGGTQHRPAIHIDDMVDVYLFFLDHPELSGIFNASFQNITIREIAEQVTAKIPARISTRPSNDPRSYRICVEKLLNAGFIPRKSVAHAIAEIAETYAQGKLKDEDRWYNVRWMKEHPPSV